jgi:hypothetical protein
VHGEVPVGRTLVGGAMVMAALLMHLAWQMRQSRQPRNVPLAD